MAKKIIQRGAEAVLSETDYLDEKALEKHRQKKNYRLPELDQQIRWERTKTEALLLHKAKQAGVRTPVIFKVDRKQAKIIMELLPGQRLKKVLNQQRLDYCFQLGKNIGRLHKNNLIHGDLTTSNVMVKGKDMAFIDFGLGFQSAKLEDKATDLMVLKKTFMATHYQIQDKGWAKILQGYLKTNPDQRVIKQLTAIEKRGRYQLKKA
jgi:Kae1-associated kinase Bud32